MMAHPLKIFYLEPRRLFPGYGVELGCMPSLQVFFYYLGSMGGTVSVSLLVALYVGLLASSLAGPVDENIHRHGSHLTAILDDFG